MEENINVAANSDEYEVAHTQTVIEVAKKILEQYAEAFSELAK